MDIWDWVCQLEDELRREGHHRLADLVDEFPGYCVDDKHQMVDATYPEFLSLAKKHGNPWLEVFVRHWYLQSTILHRYQPKGMLTKAIELLDISSRDQTKACPQSICAVQDLANCYSLEDGQGYAEQRINVSQETLSRIDPSWPCYQCIGIEYLAALQDQGRSLFAYEESRRMQAELLKHDKEARDYGAFNFIAGDCLIDLGRYVEAYELYQKTKSRGGGESFERRRNQNIAMALCFLGKFEEAKEYELSFDEVRIAQTYYYDWCRIQLLKVQAEQNVDYPELTLRFNQLLDDYEINGCWRYVVNVSNIFGAIAEQYDDVFSLGRLIDRIHRVIPNLAQDLGASVILATWKEKYKSLKNKLEFSLSEADDIERDNLSILSLKYARSPESSEISQYYFDALVTSGYISEAMELSKELIALYPQSTELISRIGFLYIDEKELDLYDQLFSEQYVEQLNDELKKQVFWLHSFRYEADLDKALTYLNAVLEIQPDAFNTRLRAANFLLEKGDYEQAINYFDTLIESDEELKWDLLLALTLAEQWYRVRQVAVELGFEFELNDLPFDEPLGRVRIEMSEASGEKFQIYAKKLGPLHAQIDEIRPMDETQFYGDIVAFSSVPLNQLDQEDDEGYSCDSEGYYTLLFPHYRMMKKADYCYFSIDGFKPTESIWNAFQLWCDERSIVVDVRSTDEYEVEYKSKDIPAIYVYLACPNDDQLKQDLNIYLTALRKEVGKPMIWPQLAELLGDEQEIELQASYETEYGFS